MGYRGQGCVGLALFCACTFGGSAAQSGADGGRSTGAPTGSGVDEAADDGPAVTRGEDAATAGGGSGPGVSTGPQLTSTDDAPADTMSMSTADDTSGTTQGSGTTDTGPAVLYESCNALLEAERGAQSGVHAIDVPGIGPIDVYCDMDTDGGGWTRFWWWTPGEWPAEVNDVLQSPFGVCEPDAPYCFARLPALDEDETSLLAFEPTEPTKYRWDFDPDNNTAHAAWMAFAEHTQIPSGEARHGDPWSPILLEGSSPPASTQDSFMYRVEHGVASILMDDDNCDDQTTLQMGHGMCYGGWGGASSEENSYGVDLLFDPNAEDGPRPEYHLELFYR